MPLKEDDGSGLDREVDGLLLAIVQAVGILNYFD